MSLSSGLMVKVEAEGQASADVSCELVDLERHVKDEPGEEPPPQEFPAVNDPLTIDSLRKLPAFDLEPCTPEPRQNRFIKTCRICGRSITSKGINVGPTSLLRLQHISERRQDYMFPPIHEKIQLHASCRVRYIDEEHNQTTQYTNRSQRANVHASVPEEVYNETVEDSGGSEYQEQSFSSDVVDVSGSGLLESESSVSETSASEYKGNEFCRVCGASITVDSILVGPKGLANLTRASGLRRDGKFPPPPPPAGAGPLRLHSRCRKLYINQRMIDGHVRRLERSLLDPDAPPLQQLKGFDYVMQCVICAGDASEAYAKRERKVPARKRNSVRRVGRPDTRHKLLRASFDLPPASGQQLRKRVDGKDLIGLQARYHALCYSRLMCGNLHRSWEDPGFKRGRPPSKQVQEECQLVCDYIESNWDDSQIPHDDISKGTGMIVNNNTLVHKLPERYGIALRKRGYFVISPGITITDDWYREKLDDERNERLRIVRTAANIILEDIRAIPFDNKSYPSPSSFLDDVDADVPETLKTLVGTVVTKYKSDRENLSGTVTALSHSLMTAARPNSFKSPLLLGIGSFINQKHTSKSLIEMLSSVGFCAPYKEVTEFEMAVAYKQQSKSKVEFSQFAFDAVDTEVNGHSSQVVAGVQCVSPHRSETPLRRRPGPVTPEEAEKTCSKAPLKTYTHGTSGLKNVTIEDHRDDTAILPTRGDALWLFGKSDPSLDIPSWDAFLNKMPKHKMSPLAEIRPLPIIRAPASYDAVYSALKHAQLKSKGGVCVVTFGQPLYQIAQDIVNSDTTLSDVVLRLGGFHLMMAYLGSVGYIMSGSGLEQLWCGIYAPEQIGKMMTGHAFARAVRAHFLTRSALFNIITKDFDLTPEEKLEIESIMDGTQGMIEKDDEISGVNKYQEPLSITLELLEKRGPTAQLWVQYFRMTTLMAQFMEAERTADWHLHLSTLKKMMPYFHASGHFEYAKSCSLYLQDMQKLNTKMTTEEFENFTKKGYFAVSRTDDPRADVWSDLIVEQTMARLMERPGGVANGRTVTDSVLEHWASVGPALSMVADIVESFCKGNSTCDEELCRHKDNEDIVKLQNWIEDHNPFTETENLVSIGTGVLAGSEVRCHEAGDVGRQIMAQQVGKNFHKVKYQRDKCVLPLSSINSAVQIDNFMVPVESDTILKRIHITKENQEDMKSFFKYELAPYPLSLFNDHGMIKESKKSEVFQIFVPVEMAEGGNRSHVIDGRFLLRKVPWKEGADIVSIINAYVEYVKTHFTNAVVVFGGHGIREKNNVKSESPVLEFQKDTVIKISQESFLSNEKNRDKLIQYLMIDFTRSGITVKLSPNDVDAFIVQTATANASTYEETCVVSDDPDLLVILTGHAAKMNIYFMIPGRGKKPNTYYHVDSFSSNKMKLSVMFIHAVCGTDFTSTMFGKNRTDAIKTISSIHFRDVRDIMTVFKDPNADPEAIAEAGYKFMLHYYLHDDIQDLNVVRLKQFAKCVTKNKRHLASLPPTKEVVRQHMYRTYHQIQMWLGNDLPPTDWGWKFVEDRLEPIATLAEPAPKELLDLISCKCVNICTAECSCKRAGLDCCVLCVNCNGKVCHGVDMDVDAYEERYRILSGCDAFGNPVDKFELNTDREVDEIEETESEPTRPKRPRRETMLKDKNNTAHVEQVYIVEFEDQEPTSATGVASRETRRSLSLPRCTK